MLQLRALLNASSVSPEISAFAKNPRLGSVSPLLVTSATMGGARFVVRENASSCLMESCNVLVCNRNEKG